MSGDVRLTFSADGGLENDGDTTGEELNLDGVTAVEDPGGRWFVAGGFVGGGISFGLRSRLCGWGCGCSCSVRIFAEFDFSIKQGGEGFFEFFVEFVGGDDAAVKCESIERCVNGGFVNLEHTCFGGRWDFGCC